MTLLAVLLRILAGFLAVALVALSIPLRMAGLVQDLHLSESSGANLEATGWRFEVSWLFGLLVFTSFKEPGAEPRAEARLAGVSKPMEGGGAEPDRVKRPAKKAKPQRKRRRGISGREAWSLLPELRGLMARLWRSLGFEGRGELTYGFEDPYLTGLCEGLRAMVPMPRELHLTPDFGEARLEGWAQAQMTVYPIWTVGLLVGTLFRRRVRRIWWSRLKTRFAVFS